MKRKVLLVLGVIFDPAWSMRNWDVVKREWKMKRL